MSHGKYDRDSAKPRNIEQTSSSPEKRQFESKKREMAVDFGLVSDLASAISLAFVRSDSVRPVALTLSFDSDGQSGLRVDDQSGTS